MIHKSRAITYISPEARAAADKQQTLVIQGKGKLVRRMTRGLSTKEIRRAENAKYSGPPTGLEGF